MSDVSDCEEDNKSVSQSPIKKRSRYEKEIYEHDSSSKRIREGGFDVHLRSLGEDVYISQPVDQHEQPDNGKENVKKVVEEVIQDPLSEPLIDFSLEGKVGEVTPTFSVKTMNVKDFCNVIVGFGNVPNLEHILFEFDPKGMTMYGKPVQSPVVVLSFWNVEMFQDYTCVKSVRKWVSKDRVENLRKKISKDVECITIEQLISEGVDGLTFTGSRLYKTGGTSEFSFNIFEWKNTMDAVEMNVTYNWHVHTSSQKLNHNVDFIDDKSEFISLELKNNSLIFKGISDTGMVAEQIQHETDTPDMKTNFSALFHKRFLKIITSTQALHKTVVISFNPDEGDCIYPVLFSYSLDQASPQSHFSAYLLPFVN